VNKIVLSSFDHSEMKGGQLDVRGLVYLYSGRFRTSLTGKARVAESSPKTSSVNGDPRYYWLVD